jgi:Tfp pilus assembly protein PilO
MDHLRGRTVRWAGGGAALCLAILAVTWFVFIAPSRGQVAGLQEQTESETASNAMLRTRIEQLRAQYTELATTKAQLARIHEELPTESGMSDLVRAVDSLATKTGVELMSITPSAAKAVSSKQSQGSASPPDGAAAGGSGTSSAAGTLVSIPVTVVVSGEYFQAVTFLRDLQTAVTRAFLVTGLQVDRSTGESEEGIQMSISGQVFSLSRSVAALGTQPSPSASPSSTASPSAQGSLPATASPPGGASPAASPSAQGSLPATASAVRVPATAPAAAGAAAGDPRSPAW